MVLTWIMMPVDQMGISLRRVLRDYTCFTEHILHEFGADPSELNSLPGSPIMQSLFSHLGTCKNSRINSGFVQDLGMTCCHRLRICIEKRVAYIIHMVS